MEAEIYLEDIVQATRRGRRRRREERMEKRDEELGMRKSDKGKEEGER